MDAPLFHILHGSFVVVGYSPDGDSIRFVADDASQYRAISDHTRLRFGKDGSVQIRADGIDAPELHYRQDEQPLAIRSRDALLAELGFGAVAYVDRFAIHAEHSVRGAIAVRSIDTRGRPIGYLFRAEQAQLLGRRTQLSSRLLGTTVNAAMLARGMAYPLAYDSQHWRHRRLFASLAIVARAARRGVWAIDRTARFPLASARSLGVHGALVYPKLFRRCIEYLANRRAGSRIETWLETQAGGDNDLVLIDRRLARLSTFVRESDHGVRASLDPVRVVFVAR